MFQVDVFHGASQDMTTDIGLILFGVAVSVVIILAIRFMIAVKRWK